MKEHVQFETERLTIRTIQLTDAAMVYHYRSDAKTNKFQGWIPTSLKETESFIKNKVAAQLGIADSWFQLVIIIKESKELIGDIGLHFLQGNTLEIGCTLNKEHQGKAYSSEALRGVLKFVFEQLRIQKIKASVDPRNKASIHMLEALGMKQEAYFEKSFFFKDEWVDDAVYTLNLKG